MKAFSFNSFNLIILLLFLINVSCDNYTNINSQNNKTICSENLKYFAVNIVSNDTLINKSIAYSSSNSDSLSFYNGDIFKISNDEIKTVKIEVGKKRKFTEIVQEAINSFRFIENFENTLTCGYISIVAKTEREYVNVRIPYFQNIEKNCVEANLLLEFIKSNFDSNFHLNQRNSNLKSESYSKKKCAIKSFHFRYNDGSMSANNLISCELFSNNKDSLYATFRNNEIFPAQFGTAVKAIKLNEKEKYELCETLINLIKNANISNKHNDNDCRGFKLHFTVNSEASTIKYEYDLRWASAEVYKNTIHFADIFNRIFKENKLPKKCLIKIDY
jgi:hypothetical protein